MTTIAVSPKRPRGVFASRAAELTHAQVEDAFRAANANEQELRGFADAVYARIRDVVTRVQ